MDWQPCAHGLPIHFLLEVVLMSLIVQKFGGSSVRSAAQLLQMARIVRAERARGNDAVLVLSAQGDTTDTLLAAARELMPQPPPRELDMLLSAGEQMSAALGAMALRSLGVEAVSLCAWQLPVHTDGVHTDARIERIDTRRLRRELDAGRVAVVAGFQGINDAGDITTLGRGGSDTSAAALAAALHADTLIIRTDVDGVYSADPRLCPTAVHRARVSYDDMFLLARKGAQVLHARSVETAARAKIPIAVRSCAEESIGSIVCAEGGGEAVVGVTQRVRAERATAEITAVGAALPSVALERAAITALERAGVSVLAVAAGERFMTLCVPEQETARALTLVHGALVEAE